MADNKLRRGDGSAKAVEIARESVITADVFRRMGTLARLAVGYTQTGKSAHPSASVVVFSQGGGSPLQADVLRPVAEGNCVLVRGGGEQPEANDQSVAKANSIRPD